MKFEIDVPNEVHEFMSKHHISEKDVIQAGYDFYKVLKGERKMPPEIDQKELAKFFKAMYGHYGEEKVEGVE